MFENKKKFLFLILSILIILVLVVAGLSKERSEKEYFWANEIVITPKGFEPSEIAVFLGDEVVFINKSGQDAWPASDFHPSHSIYPEFDTKMVLKDGDSWTFKFNQRGVWNFHDHLSSFNRGTIYVLENKDDNLEFKSVEECLVSFENNTDYCVSSAIDNALQKDGVEGALRLFDRFKDLMVDCHELAHRIGEASFEAELNGEKVKYGDITNQCTWGFWHGFSTKFAQHVGGDYGEIKKFCNEIDKKLKSNYSNCFHGIGIGLVPDPPNPSIWGNSVAVTAEAVRTCDIAKSNERDYLDCLGGAFHGVISYMRERVYGLKIDQNDPFKICKAQEGALKKSACYSQTVQLSTLVSEDRIWEYTDIFLNSESDLSFLKDGDEGTYISLMAQVQVPYRKNFKLPVDPKSIFNVCKRIQENYQKNCLSGMALGYIGTGVLEDREYLDAGRLCSFKELSTEESKKCGESLVSFMYITYGDDDYKKACDDLKKETGLECVR